MTLFSGWSLLTKRILAVALLGLAIVLSLDVVVLPVAGAFMRQGERISQLERNYALFAQAAARRPVLEAEVKRLGADHTWRRRLVDAPSEPEAHSALQQRIRQAADASGIEVQSFEPLGSQHVQGFTKVGVRVEIRSNTEAMARFLEAVEGAPELVVFESVVLRTRGTGNPHDKLQVRADLAGYWLPREPSR